MICQGREGGCDRCGHRGDWTLDEPMERFVDSRTHNLMRYADLARRVALPVTGGLLDQTPFCRDLMDWVEQEERCFRAAPTGGIEVAA